MKKNHSAEPNTSRVIRTPVNANHLPTKEAKWLIQKVSPEHWIRTQEAMPAVGAECRVRTEGGTETDAEFVQWEFGENQGLYVWWSPEAEERIPFVVTHWRHCA